MVEDSRQRQTPTLFRRKQQPVTERGRGQRRLDLLIAVCPLFNDNAFSGEEREWPMAGGGGTLLSRSSSQPFLPPQGISIPQVRNDVGINQSIKIFQHIIIPPVARRVDASGTLDSQVNLNGNSKLQKGITHQYTYFDGTDGTAVPDQLRDHHLL